MAVCKCVRACLCHVSWHWERAFRSGHVVWPVLFWSVVCLTSSLDVSLYPRSICCKGYGPPCPVVAGPGRPRCAYLIALVPWPSPSLPHPFGGRPSAVQCPQALTAQTLPPTLATWTHRCQVKLTPGFKAPAPPSRGQEA